MTNEEQMASLQTALTAGDFKEVAKLSKEIAKTQADAEKSAKAEAMEAVAEITRLEAENERLRRWDAKYTDGMTPTVAEQLLKCSATEFQGFWELICDVGEAERLQRWVRVKLKELAEAKDVVVEFLEAEAAMLDGQEWRLRTENQDHRHKRFSAAHDALKTAGDLQQPLEQEVRDE